MTEENNLQTTEQQSENTVKIYSKRAIMGFSVFFTPVFGGVLLRQNLIDYKMKKEANTALLVSIGLTALVFIIIEIMPISTSTLTLVLNIIGGSVLSEYFYKKYFPNKKYEYKKIWKPLIISLIITIPLALIAFYAIMNE